MKNTTKIKNLINKLDPYVARCVYCGRIRPLNKLRDLSKNPFVQAWNLDLPKEHYACNDGKKCSAFRQSQYVKMTSK